MKNPTVSGWRKNKSWPTDDNMEKLALMGSEDPEAALIELQIWNNEGPAKVRWVHIYEQLAAAAAAIVLITAIYPTPALAIEQTAHSSTLVGPIVYIMDKPSG
ncbi:MAG: hypothetical protein JKY17_03820 [Magnetovibrio sp.]|nr:hypothetical protein [Magnetovibrio sp.]